MKRVATLLALVPLLLLTAPLMAAANVSAQEIPYGGRFAVGFLESLSTLTCGEEWQYNDMGCIFWPLVYDQLWILSPEGEIQPRLAESWESSENGKVWTFHLRHDAKWHDGQPVTAEDVAFTAENLPQVEVWWYVDTDFEEVEVIDEYTVRLTLVNPISRPPMYWCPILPKHIWEPYAEDLLEYDNKDAIGSGPFKLKEFRSEEYVLLEANEEYWGGRPYVDEVLLIAYANEEAQILALKKGDIQTIGYRGLSSPAAAEKLRGEPNIEIGEYPGLGIWWLSIDLYKEGPLQDLNVRKAIAYAINRDRIIDTVYMGYAEKADSFVYPELDIHNPNLPQYDYNPTLAAQILDEAGYVDIDGDGVRETPEGDDLSFEMITASAWPDAIKIASLIKEDLAAIGINIKVSPLDEDVYYTMVYEPTESEYDIAIHEEEPGILVDWIWYFCLDPEDMGAGWNTAYYYNPEFDELYFEQVSEFDPEKRKQLIWQMQELLAEDLPYIFLVRPKELVPYRTDKFEGYVGTIGGLSSWVNPWTYLKVHLKAAPAPPPPPAPGPAIPMTAIAGGIVALVIIVGVAYYAVKRRGS